MPPHASPGDVPIPARQGRSKRGDLRQLPTVGVLLGGGVPDETREEVRRERRSLGMERECTEMRKSSVKKRVYCWAGGRKQQVICRTDIVVLVLFGGGEILSM
mmetsp:Transcript_32179/g.96437  ORF Transcript_32179/g.96437 Transcript_32179/m.96437 type:complete len:103 (+) Transcript_32179:520-828(+)